MTAEDWTLVTSVFSRALAVELDKRESWILEQSALSTEVKSEVLRLLDSQPETHGHSTPMTFGESSRVLNNLVAGEVLLGRFQILEHLGSGAMGDVYSSLDRELGETVAIKTLRSHLVNQPDLICRLRREVQLARRVRHKNVCQVFELHQDAERKAGLLTFFTMEGLSGETLSARISQGRLEIAEASNIAQDIADGLTAIHSASLVHRDLKPANVFLVRDDAGDKSRAVIADFGLCFDERRPVTESLSMFGPEAVVGTPAYMSPEQLLGKGANQRSDIYSFGVLLFEMVTGRLPFNGETPLAIALRRLQLQQAPSPRTLNASLPIPWERAILSCLASEPMRRPRSVAEVIECIDGVRQLSTPRRFTRRQIWALGAASGATLAVLGSFELTRSSAYSPDTNAEYHLKLGQEFAKQPSPEGIRSAIDEFRQAVTIDPNYADGWSELADAYCLASTYSTIPSRVARKDAEASAKRALVLDGKLSKAHAAYAYALGMDLRRWRQAGSSFERAISLTPKEPLVRSWYAGFLGRAGRFSEAVEMARSALQLDPGAFHYNYRLGVELFRARRFQDVVDQMRSVVRLHPSEGSAFRALARGYEWLRRFVEAEAALRQADELPDKSGAGDFWATLYAAMGKRDAAERLVGDIRREWQEEKHETISYLAVLGALSERNAIVEVMTDGIRREDETVLAAASNPYLDASRNDARYVELLRSIDFR